MEYRYLAPEPQLAEEVRTMLIVEGSGRAASKVPLFTNGMPALLCRTLTNREGKVDVIDLSLHGKSTPADGWEVSKAETIIACFFKPFALAPLFNLAASDLKKESISLEQWDAHKTHALKVQLNTANSAEKKVAAMGSLLLTQWKEQGQSCKLIRMATDRMMNDSGKDVLTALKKELAVNERTFQRVFKKYVGVTPNQYRRICQFQLSFACLRGGRFKHLADVAFDTGFADQSHFIRTFKEFTESRPRDYMKKGLQKKRR